MLKIKYAKTLLIALPIVAVAILLTALSARSLIVGQETPTSLVVKVYKASLHAGAGDTTGTTIFTNAAGIDMDIIANGAGFLFGEGTSLPVGEYSRIKLTVLDQVDATTAIDPCGASTTTFQSGVRSAATSTSQVDIVFATNGDGGGQNFGLAGGADGTWAKPFGLGEDNVILEEGATTVIDFKWNVVGLMQCIDNNGSATPDDADLRGFGTLSAQITEYIEEAGACTVAGSEYWMVRNVVRSYNENPDGTTSDFTNDASVLSAWGTLNFNADGLTVDVAAAKGIPDVVSDPSGMTEHRHMLLTLDKTNPSGDDGIVHNDALFEIPYELHGNEIFLDLGDAILQGGVSLDCSTIVLTAFEGNDADLLIAVKKPTPTKLANMLGTPDGNGLSSYDPGAKMVLTWPSFELGFANNITLSDTIYNAANVYLSPELNVLDFSPPGLASDEHFNWASMTHFSPVYNHTDGAANQPHFYAWVSAGPKERAEGSSTGDLHAFLRFRADGIANINTSGEGMDSFIGIGDNGSFLVAGTAIDNDIATDPKDGSGIGFEENHRLQAGLGIKAHTAPTKAMLTGKWLFAGMSMEFGDGLDGWASDYSMPPSAPGGNETANFSLERGILRINSAGIFNGTFTSKNLMTNQTRSDVIPDDFIYLTAPALECYGVGLSTDDATCTGGIQIYTFRIFEDANGNATYDAGEEGMLRMVLDQSGTVMALFDQIDNGGTPYNTPDVPKECDYTGTGESAETGTHVGCGDANSYTNFFTAVKVD